MKERILALVGFVCAAAGSLAATNIKLVDWGATPPVPADGTADLVVIPQILDLTNPDANVTYMGQVWGTRPGIQTYEVKNQGDSSYQLEYLLCVQLEEGIGNSTYGYKDIAGYAGFLAEQIPGIVAGSDPGHIKAAALALATWELDYDGYDPSTNSVNLANLSLDAGKVTYVQTNETNAEYAAIKDQANTYISELQAINPDQAKELAYRYYANPYTNDQDKGYQDYITAPVPEPASLAAVLIGVAGLAIRRRKKA